MDSPKNHEIDFIKAFIIKERQERFLALVQNKKSRKKFRLLLAHNIEFSENKGENRLIKKEEDNDEKIYQLLKKYGAPDACHIMCESSKYDDSEANLKEALNELFNSGFGYIISCIPGKLAYYQGEDTFNKLILLNQLSNV